MSAVDMDSIETQALSDHNERDMDIEECEESKSDDLKLAISKKRKIESYDYNESKEVKEMAPPMPYTCICFGGAMYTTDQDGMFVHREKDSFNVSKLYRCQVDAFKEIQFVHIRDLSDNELVHFENADCVNAMNSSVGLY